VRIQKGGRKICLNKIACEEFQFLRKKFRIKEFNLEISKKGKLNDICSV